MDRSRRSFLKGLACAGATAAASAAPAAASEPRKAPDDAVGMLYDTTRCIGCKTCVVACHEANDLPPDDRGNGLHDAPQALNDRTKNIIKLFKDEHQRSYMKQQCMHCIDPGCVNACMIGAFKKREFGIVTWDKDRCIGCRYCQVACPYNIPKFQWDTAVPEIVKCELCNHMLARGEEPGCVQACPKEAVIFGTYEELLADARQRVADHPELYYPAGDPQIFGDTEGGGTQVLYLAGVDFEPRLAGRAIVMSLSPLPERQRVPRFTKFHDEDHVEEDDFQDDDHEGEEHSEEDAGPAEEPAGEVSEEPAEAAVERFVSDEFKVTDAYDRMGMRLNGPSLELVGALSIPSEPIVRGSVQVSGDGVPTVLLADHQTTGGYPKIATVISSDIDRLSQFRAGQTLRFTAISSQQAIDEARRHHTKKTQYIDQISVARGTLEQRLMRENLIHGCVYD